VEKRQYGKYFCRAANKLGNVEASVELFGKFSPFYCCARLQVKMSMGDDG
jgi:hypothetical protein